VRRVPSQPRADWQRRVAEVGLIYHTHDDGSPYWTETAHYRLTADEVDELERVTDDLHALCLNAVQHVIDRERWADLRIGPLGADLVRRSWEADEPGLYGRFDLSHDGVRPPRLLEYNADTPTSLLEAAVVQWYWLQDVAPKKDQFNSIHERLVAAWAELKPGLGGAPLHVAAVDDWEDAITAAYLRDTAEQAGIAARQLGVESIGWDAGAGRFVDDVGDEIRAAFKLYPWEWMIQEEFAAHLAQSAARTRWIEPAWKMVLSNKGILPILWELNPGHPNLLEAYLDEPRGLRQYARKPLFSREGANVTLVSAGRAPELGPDGGYGGEGHVFQDLAPLPNYGGNRPVVGSWVIGGASAGIGIRESDAAVTTNTSRFVPHLFE
jgi:glutathionylspermidine synthase